VFPAGNTLVRRSALDKSGLFDYAYDRGSRADGDLGMRIYLSGGLMVLNAGIRVLHHHAPQGGLRTHNARTITFARSRNSLWKRHTPGATQIYLARRYYSTRQVREMLLLAAAGTLSSRGSLARKSAKLVVGLCCMPLTISDIKRRYDEASALLESYPSIPALDKSTPATAAS
jgi:hypothetical protein